MSKKLTTEEFIAKAKKVHGDKYDYSLVEYTKNRGLVQIICREHGLFEKSPNKHLSGQGCQQCGFKHRNDSSRISTEEFINTSILIHGDKYDYNMVTYIDAHTNVKIKCKTCDKYFDQNPYSHKHGYGCPICSQIIQGKCRRHTETKFITDAILIHGNHYNYTYMTYVNKSTKVKILCNICNIFTYTTPSVHLIKNSGGGCPKCKIISIRNNQKTLKTTTQFIMDANIKHNNYYDYSKTNYINAHTKVTIICPVHGEFQQKPNNHLSGKGCALCKISKGELKIKTYLTQNNIEYIREYKYDNCKNKLRLPFDFYIPKYNTCIEYDGEFDYKPYKNEDKYIKILNTHKYRDYIKTQYCMDNTIKLIRIPYWDFDNIEEILKRELI